MSGSLSATLVTLFFYSQFNGIPLSKDLQDSRILKIELNIQKHIFRL